MGEFIEEGTFDRAEFSKELEAAPDNTDVGTKVWFENDSIRVWEIRLAPGERAPFHHHTRRYFWTAVEDSVGKQRTADGTYRVREYGVGDTMYLEQSPDEQMIHDLENIGDTEMRFVTVELLD